MNIFAHYDLMANCKFKTRHDNAGNIFSELITGYISTFASFDRQIFFPVFNKYDSNIIF